MKLQSRVQKLEEASGANEPQLSSSAWRSIYQTIIKVYGDSHTVTDDEAIPSLAECLGIIAEVYA